MVSNQPLSKPIQELSTLEDQGFDYHALNSETRTIIQQHTTELKSLIRHTSQSIIDIGKKLIEVKQQLGYGNFRNWLKAEFDWGIWTANKFIQVAKKFGCVNFTHLDIAASALYLLAAPSTPSVACKKAIELATQGEAISHTKAKAIIAEHKEIDKSKAPKVAVDIPAEIVVKNSSTTAEPRRIALQNLEAKSTVLEQSEDKLRGKEIEIPAYSHMNNYSNNIPLIADSGNYLLGDQAEIDVQLLFSIGHLIYLTDFGQQESKLLGEIAEVKEVTTTDVVIRISLTGNNLARQLVE